MRHVTQLLLRSVLAYNGEQERELVAKGEELATTFRKLVQHPAAHYRTLLALVFLSVCVYCVRTLCVDVYLCVFECMCV